MDNKKSNYNLQIPKNQTLNSILILSKSQSEPQIHLQPCHNLSFVIKTGVSLFLIKNSPLQNKTISNNRC